MPWKIHLIYAEVIHQKGAILLVVEAKPRQTKGFYQNIGWFF